MPIKFNFATGTFDYTGSSGGGTWETLTGSQASINLSGFTNDVPFLTSADLAPYVLKAGDTMTGNLTISKANPKLIVTDTGLSSSARLEKDTTADGSRLVSQNRVYIVGKALSMNGSGYASRAAITLGTVYSVDFFYKTSSTASQMPIAGNTATQNILFWFSAATTISARTATSVQVDWAGITYADGVKHHWVITANGTTLELFKDGVSQGTRVAASVASRSYTNIGSYGDFNHKCVGELDELVVWDKVLTGAEITARYNSGNGSELTSWTNVVAEYRFNNDYADSSPNAYSLSAGGSGNSFVSGMVSTGVQSLSDIPILKISNNSTDTSYGNLQLGHYSGSYGTSNVYEGLTHRFNRLGSMVASLNGTQVIYGHSNTDSRANSIILGTGNTAAATSGTESIPIVGVSNTASGQRSGIFGVSNTASGGLNNTWIFGYGNSAVGSQAIVIGNNITSVPANTMRLGHDNSNFINFSTSGTLSVYSSAFVIGTLNSTGLGIGATAPTYQLDIQSSAASRTARIKSTLSGGTADLILDSGATANPSVYFLRGGGNNWRIYSNNSNNLAFYSFGSAPNANSLVITASTHAATFTGSVTASSLAATGNVATSVSATRTDNASAYFLAKNLNAGNATIVGLQLQTNSGSSYIWRGGPGLATTNLRDATIIQEAGTNGIVFYTSAEMWRVKQDGNLLAAEGINIETGTTTGTKIGTATTQKLSFWNATPIVQPTTAGAAATFVANTSAIADDTATFDGYTIGQVVKALRNAGLLA